MAVDDSSSWPSFRQLDDVFLQSQARIWLGEVLHTRFDEQLSICDLLSDGELLFEVSKALWNMLLIKYMELKSFKDRMFIPVDTRKNSGRYRPYSNVDSFLKVCKVLGLSGVDLFSPSDVVEKRDSRKVCICIRSLSKKARSKQLNVPDFDVVTETVVMPTYVVRCIRRSLELSTSSGQIEHARLKPRQKSSFASHKQEDELYPEESDEAKSNISDTAYADFLCLELGESTEIDDKYALTQHIGQFDTSNQEINKFAHRPGSVESLLLQYADSENQLDGISSPFCELKLIICDEFTPINHGGQFLLDNGENVLNQQKMGEVDHHFSLSDMILFRILTNVPFHTSEDCLCHSCMDTESHNSNTTPNSSICRVWRKFPDDVEASPTSSVSSVLGHVLDFDFDFDVDAKSEPDDVTTLVSSTPNLQHAAKRLDKVSGFCNQAEIEMLDIPAADSLSPCWDDAKSYSLLDQDPESSNQISLTQKDLGDSLVFVKDDVTKIADSIQETVASKGSNDKVDFIFNDHVAVKLSERCDCYSDDGTKAATKDERKDDGNDCLTKAINNKRTEKKPSYIAPLFKTVAKGTALIGILFLLHLRNMSDRNTNNKSTEKSSQIHWKSSGVGFSRRKGEKGRRIYPVENLKFGD